jgi:hypothetical protein
VPDKRQESKQRRAARNRANREALAARRDNAVAAAAAAPKASGDGAEAATTGTARGSGRGRAASAAAPTPSAPVAPTSGRRPGEIFLWIALGFAVLGTLAMLFYIKVPVDDRGEPIPGGANPYGGLTIAAREAVTGEPLPDTSISYLDAYGATALITAALPLSLTAFAVWASRRRADRSRMLTYAMLGMAVAIFLGGGLFVFFPALIFLAIGGFLARRADLPARVAERATGTGGGFFGRGRGTVIDADSEEVVDVQDAPTAGAPDEGAVGEPDEGVADEPAANRTRRKRRREAPGAPAADEADDVAATDTDAGGRVGPEDAGSGEVDPLAELEAELEAERAAEAAARGEDADQAGDGGTPRTR